MLGRHHPLVARLRALRRDGARRREEGVLVAEGMHLVREALLAGARISCVVVSPRLTRTSEGRGLHAEILHRGIELLEAEEGLLDSLQDARSPQPILAVVHADYCRLDDALALPKEGVSPLVVVVDHVQDPGNLGAIVRTADAAGATGFVASGESADLHHPRAVRATMGSLFRLPAATASRAAIEAALRERGFRMVATAPRDGTPYDAVDLTGPLALVLGGEGAGLGPAWLDVAHARVSIPIRAGVDSLSVGAAAAVLLFEAARQRARG
jgi:TrmH family RNA methyltransferase